MPQYNPKIDFFYKKVRKNNAGLFFCLKYGIRSAILFKPAVGFPESGKHRFLSGIPGQSDPHEPPPALPMNFFLLSILCLMICTGATSCRSTAAADAETVGTSEVMEFEDCVLSEPCILVTPDLLDTLPEAVRDEAKKHCGKPGIVVVASSLRPRYYRLIRRQERLLLGSNDAPAVRNTVFLSVITGLGMADNSIRSITIEKADSPEPWNLGVFIKRYPELADRIAELPPGDKRFTELESAARELLKRGSTRIMLERHSRTKDPSALEAAARAEQEQITVMEEILNTK